jgi:prepilin-type N-terminal cleavage/methylation domain-containing protein
MKKYRTNYGFTLIETLVAVSIVSLAVTGPLVAASRSIVSAEVARDKLIASYLAQEGVEYIRAMRDDSYLAIYGTGSAATLSERAWNSFYSANDATSITQCRSNPCTLDRTKSMNGVETDPTADSDKSLRVCTTSGCRPLYLTSANTYTQVASGNTQTPFTRTITITDQNAEKEMKVSSNVSWTFHGTPYNVTVIDHLTKWQ